MSNFQVSPSAAQIKLPLLQLSIICAGLILGIGGSYFLHPLLPLGLMSVVCLFIFRQWIRFEWLLYAMMVMFLLISPNVPPHEKHFRSPILLNFLLAQDLLLLAALFLFMVALTTERVQFPKPNTLVEKAFVLLVISFFCSLIVGVWKGNRTDYVWSEARDFAYLLLFWLIVAYSGRFENVYKYFLVFIGCCGAFAIFSIVDAAVRYKFSRYNSGISFLLLPGFIFSISALVIQAFKKPKALLAGLLVTVALAILVSFTRGLYLGVVAGLLAVMLCAGTKQTLRLMFLLAIASSVIIAVLFLLNLTPDFLVRQTVNRGMEVAGEIDISTAERVLEVVAVLNAFPNHPIFGDGIGGTIRVYRFTDLVGKAGMTDWWFIHNNYFQTLHKQGLFGLLMLLFLWISTVWKSYTLYKAEAEPKKKVMLLTALGTFVGYMVISITSPVMTYSNTNFLNALLFAVVAIIAKEQSHASNSLQR